MRIRDWSPEKRQEGTGLDYEQETTLDDGRVVSAAEALLCHRPSKAMYQRAREIVEYLSALGCNAPDCVADYDAARSRPGGLMLRWGDPKGRDGEAPLAAQVAERFGPLPCWLQLRPDDDFDLRYQVPRGPLDCELRPTAPLGPRSRRSPLAGRLAAA